MTTTCPGRHGHTAAKDVRRGAPDHRAAERGWAANDRPSGTWSFSVLGTLEVHGPTGAVAPGPPQRRVLLLRLLTEDGWPVSVERLCEDLWEGRPPSAAVSSVRAHISRLRSALAVSPETGTGMLTHTSAGYALHVTREQRDDARFEDAVQYAHGLVKEERWAQARAEAEKALSLWRGRPYADADGKLFVRREATRLSELRWSARELQAGLLLEDGEVTRSLAVAEEIVSGNPLREDSWAVLLRGLYLTGRAGEALHRFDAVRRLLAEELGTDPGPALQRVHMAILRHDTEALRPLARTSARLTPASDTTDRTPSSGRVGLVGREAELLRLPAARRTGPDLTIPAAVTSVVRARLPALAPETRRVLEIAAVTGDELDVPDLAAMASLPREAVLSGLDAAVEAGLVVWRAGVTPREPGGYRLSCGLVREVLKAGLTRARGYEIHAAVYQVLAARPGSSAEAVAGHAVAAGPLVDAHDLSHAALRAGYACLERDDVAEAREWLARALAGHAAVERARGRGGEVVPRAAAGPGSDGAATAENNVVPLRAGRAHRPYDAR